MRGRGFAGAPKPLGFDEQGREVLEFVEGKVAGHPIPKWAAAPRVAFSVGELLREFRSAAESYEHEGEVRCSHEPPGQYQDGSWGHNDATPGNVVFRAGRAFALIDFDWAAPSDPLWDLANAAQHWGPACDPKDSSGAFRGSDPGERIRELAAGYGATAEQRHRLIAAIQDSLDWAGQYVEDQARSGHAGFASIFDSNYRAAHERARRWLRANSARLRDLIG